MCSAIPPANEKQGLTALANKKQEAFDQIRANMQSFRAGFAITARNINIFFPKEKHLKHLKPAATLI
jgi:hypothetical protein